MRLTAVADVTLALAARIVPGFLTLLAVPFYLHTLEPERYAAVGFYLAIQLIIGLLDFGLSASVLREASWLTGQQASALRFWTLLRTFEIPFWVFACFVTLLGLAMGDALLNWLFSVDLPTIGLEFPASALLFAAIAFRFPFAIYFGYLSGRGYVARANLIVLILESVRTIGTVFLLVIAPPSLTLFFAWQAIAALTISVTGAWVAHSSTPPTDEPVRVEWALYKDVRGLTLGTGMLSLLYVIASSLDKIVLPRFLAVADYGLYVAVGQLAVTIFMVAHAIWSAQHPRLLMALASGKIQNALDVYHVTASMMSGVCSATILAIWLSAPVIVDIWTPAGNSKGFGGVLIALTVGNAAAALSHLAFSIQHAARTMMPMLLVLAISVFGVPLGAWLMLGDFTSLTGAIAWGGIYMGLLLGGIMTYVKHGPAFIDAWCRTVLLPLLLTISTAALLSPWTHALPHYFQVAIGVSAGALGLMLNLATNRQIRDRIGSIISQIMSSRKAAQR